MSGMRTDDGLIYVIGGGQYVNIKGEDRSGEENIDLVFKNEDALKLGQLLIEESGLSVVDILAQHQPKRPVGTLRNETTGLAQGCEGCDFEAFAADLRFESPAYRLFHQFATHQAEMIREGAK